MIWELLSFVVTDKQHGNKNMGKKNYTRDSYHGKDGTSIGGQGTFGGQRDSQSGLTQKKA